MTGRREVSSRFTAQPRRTTFRWTSGWPGVCWRSGATFSLGVLPVVVPLTQDDIAQLAGTTRPTTNQVLKRLEAQGVIRSARGRADRHRSRRRAPFSRGHRPGELEGAPGRCPVSYTHLTLPTNREV